MQKVEQDIRNFLTASGLPGDDFDITIVHAEGATRAAKPHVGAGGQAAPLSSGPARSRRAWSSSRSSRALDVVHAVSPCDARHGLELTHATQKENGWSLPSPGIVRCNHAMR